MSWRDKAKAIMEAGDNRDDRDKTPFSGPNVPNVPNVPAVVPLDPARILRVWHDKLRRLDLAAVPAGMDKGEWIDLCDDTWWLSTPPPDGKITVISCPGRSCAGVYREGEWKSDKGRKLTFEPTHWLEFTDGPA